MKASERSSQSGSRLFNFFHQEIKHELKSLVVCSGEDHHDSRCGEYSAERESGDRGVLYASIGVHVLFHSALMQTQFDWLWYSEFLFRQVFAVAASVHLIWAVFISEAFTDSGLYAGKLDDLVQGWIPGRKLDMSNGNWYFLRKHIILLVPWFILMAIVSRTVSTVFRSSL